MKKPSKKAPKLRFKGFTEDWEQRELGEVLKVNSGRDYKHLKKGDIPVYGTGGYMLSVNDSLSEKDAIGIGRKGTIDNPQYLHAPFWTVDTLFYMTTHNQSNITYLYWLTKRITWKKYDESSGVPSLSKVNIEKINIKITTDEEQKKISSFLTTLENIVRLHQRKFRALEQLKEGYLQKMFPNDEELVPELRFANFSEVWEERKLGEVSEKVIEKNVNNEKFDTLTNSAEFGIINQRDFFDKKISNKSNLRNYYIVQPDDFIYNPRVSNFAPVGPIKRNKLNKTGVISPLYYVFRVDSIDKTYLEMYFTSAKWHKFMKLNGDSGARSDRFSIKDSLFREMPIPTTHNEEELLIGGIFDELSNLIDLNKRKIKQLQNMKHYYLQRMFI